MQNKRKIEILTNTIVDIKITPKNETLINKKHTKNKYKNSWVNTPAYLKKGSSDIFKNWKITVFLVSKLKIIFLKH
ncbi:MAG: hypothetical protein A2980_00090 [Candidatus Staskawiczbacteria bacterium RIFCSPLOWO2_01_FULL_33_13]|nr:MAG: hypothetical protein A2980_00090 [Candidatus Staskawiczbacteria bacterium RIFCSPLOWO2_01_FULL_33_13]